MAPARRATPWVVAMVVAVVQVAGSFGAANGQTDRRGIDAVAVALLLCGPAALALRPRIPHGPVVAVGVAMAATDVFVGRGHPYGPVFLSVVVASAWAVLQGHRRSTWAVAAAGYLGFVVADAVDPRADGSSPLHLLLAAAWLATILSVAEVVRARRTQAEAAARALEETNQRRRSEQRLHLAQDLHDVLAHHISLINVQAGVALHLLDDQPEAARPALTHIKEASRTALQELRSALDLLRQGDDPVAPRAPAPQLADLDALVGSVRASGLDVELEVDGTPRHLPPAVELAAYRIVQEALTNVTRHARAARATVRLGWGDDLAVEVSDDGPPPGARLAAEAPVPGGNGIVGMRERARSVGGSVEVGPRPSGGFRVRALLPGGPT